jgi:hypothetical protein
VRAFTEDFRQLSMAVSEDTIEVGGDQEAIDQSVSRHGVSHPVAGPGAAVVLEEGVLVNPQAVGAPPLLIDKSLRGLPACDLTLPAERDAPKPQAIIESGSGFHLDGSRGEDAEVHPGWSENGQVGGVGEEREDLRWRPGEPDLGFELKGTQRVTYAERGILGHACRQVNARRARLHPLTPRGIQF